MNAPFFTVVIPTHNRSALLKRAIESVLNQTFSDFELIIVDDYSSDNTSSVVKSFTDKRISYMLNNRTKGACGARNTGIFAANGKWIAFLDDDDVWLPEKLDYQQRVAKTQGGSIGLICTDYVIFKGEGRKPVFFKNRPSGWVRDKILVGECIGCLSSTCIRKDILVNIDGFDEAFPSSQDQDLWLRTSAVAEFCSVPKTLVQMHQDNRKERIGQNARMKLDGYLIFRNKYAELINESLRLRHRHESRIFTYAFLLKNKTFSLKFLPWFLIGIFVYCPNFLKTLRTIFILILKNLPNPT